MPIVCMLCPGGFEHAGGIGRWAGYLFANWPDSPDAPQLKMLDTRGFGGPGIAAFAFARSLIQLTRLGVSGRLGLVHINLSVRGSSVRKAIVSLLASRLGVPTIVHLHSGRFAEFYDNLPGWAKAVVLRVFDRADRVIVLGKVWEDVLVTQLGVAPAKITILPNAVPAPPPPPRLPSEICHIVMLGRLGAPKGLPELLEALGSETLRGLPWRITLAGDGDIETYRRDAESRGIAAKTDFAGWLDSPGVAALMNSADVFVLPSRSENLPVAVIEAMSYGVPVVTTPVGATPEIVTNDTTGLLVPVRDPRALAEALARLVVDPELRQRMGDAGLGVFRMRLDIKHAAATLVTMYQEVIARGRTGA